VLGEPRREVTLGRGLIDEMGGRHYRAILHPLDGWQEVSLGTWQGHLEARAIHALLAGCIEQLGEYIEVSSEHTAALSRRDRERLALELRSMLFGDRLVVSPRCPNPTCGDLADLDLAVRDILGPPPTLEPEWYQVETTEGTAWFRPPTGVDDESCETWSGSHAARAALLWSRLVQRIGERPPVLPEDWLALAPDTRQSIALALAEAQSVPDLAFVSRCPRCQAWMELDLDPFALLGRELRLGADRLVVEAHCLAFHYGWSEEQIFALPRTRRWRYLELLRSQLEGRPLVDPWS
jgi:hypothetical protein